LGLLSPPRPDARLEPWLRAEAYPTPAYHSLGNVGVAPHCFRAAMPAVPLDGGPEQPVRTASAAPGAATLSNPLAIDAVETLIRVPVWDVLLYEWIAAPAAPLVGQPGEMA